MLASDLFEYNVHYRDGRSAFSALRRYPNAFVHFSRGIKHKDRSGADQRAPSGPKLGINPRKTHRDPAGIYFYYAQWLLRSDDVSDGQYAVTSDHYWIVDLRKTQNSINLATVRWEQVEALAKRNGWHKALFSVSNDPGKLRQGPMDVRKLRSNGGRFWATMDYIANVSKEFSWMQMLKGVDAIYDPGKGYINANEPAQVIVLNPRIISVIDHGENRDNPTGAQAMVMKRVADSFGGSFAYRRGSPSIRVEIDGVPLTARIESGILVLGSFKNGVWAETQKRDYYQSMEADWMERSLKGALEDAVRYGKAEPSGRISKWTDQRMNRVVSSFLTTSIPLRQLHGKDGVLIYTTGHDGFGAVKFFFQFEADKEDTLNAKISFWLNYDERSVEIDANGTYPVDTTEDAIGADLLRKIEAGIDREVREGRLARPDTFARIAKLRLPQANA